MAMEYYKAVNESRKWGKNVQVGLGKLTAIMDKWAIEMMEEQSQELNFFYRCIMDDCRELHSILNSPGPIRFIMEESSSVEHFPLDEGGIRLWGWEPDRMAMRPKKARRSGLG